MWTSAAQRELSRKNWERFLVPSNACVPRAERLLRHRDMLPKGAHVWSKGDHGLCWLGEVGASTTEIGVYLVEFWTTRGQSSSLVSSALHDLNGPVRGSWCLQVNVANAFLRGSYVMQIIQEARSWLVDAHAAAVQL